MFELNEDLFYLVGALRDGSVFYDKAAKSYQVVWYSNNGNYMKNSITDRVLKVFNKDARIYEYKTNQFRVRITSKAGYLLIKDVFEFPKDGIGQMSWGTSEALSNADIKLKCAYIRGMFDAEGDVSLRNRYVEVSQKNTEILGWIKNEFKMLDINTGKIVIADKKTLTYKIVIAGKADVANFREKINFEHPIKRKLLKDFPTEYKYKSYLKGINSARLVPQ